MSAYWDEQRYRIAQAANKATAERQVVNNVLFIEESVLDQVLEVVTDPEFPEYNRDTILKLIGHRRLLSATKGNDRARHHLLAYHESWLLERLRTEFEHIASLAIQTRWGMITDDIDEMCRAIGRNRIAMSEILQIPDKPKDTNG